MSNDQVIDLREESHETDNNNSSKKINSSSEQYDEDYRDAEQPPFDAEGSLPDPEELHTAIAIANGHREAGQYFKKQRRNLIFMVLGAVVFGAIVGFSVGLTKNRGTTTSSSQSANAPASSQRYDQVVSFLSHYTPRSALEDTTSPQHKAATWLSDVDQRKVSIPPNVEYDSAYLFLQRFVLATMYYSLDGYNWNYEQTNFLTATSECNWNFKLKAEQKPPGSDKSEWIMGTACNKWGEINYIFLPHNNLRGQLPLEIKYLKGMEHLSLFNNKLTGELPDVKDWDKLTFLGIESNQFSGPLGDWFNFPKLQYLAIGDNQFSGTLPSFAGFTALREVSMDTNKFTGPVDVFNGASSLDILYLQSNGFTGPINDNVFKDLTLSNLDISDNFLTGSVPEHFFTYSVLDLHNNSLTGKLPTLSSTTPYVINFLSLYANKIGGSIPTTLGTTLTNLYHLDLSYNALTGPIPNTLDSLLDLEYLFLQYNPFNAGPMPEIWDLEKLKELNLHHTKRVDWLHRWVATDLPNLVLLDLSENGFHGPIPNAWGGMTNMRFLFLSNNQINGTLPAGFSNLKELTIFTMDRNSITGNDTAICGANKLEKMAFMTGDCAEFKCDCCTKCCTDDDISCYLEMKTNIDDSYDRTQYVFSEDLVFEGFSSANGGGRE